MTTVGLDDRGVAGPASRSGCAGCGHGRPFSGFDHGLRRGGADAQQNRGEGCRGRSSSRSRPFSAHVRDAITTSLLSSLLRADTGSEPLHVLCSVETAWLFTRGLNSVRIVRAAARSGVVRLIVQGPGDSTDSREFTDVVACMNYQADLERRLVSQGFALERFTSDRRSSSARRPAAAERRRLPQLFL
jgi:hypothetical protein